MKITKTERGTKEMTLSCNKQEPTKLHRPEEINTAQLELHPGRAPSSYSQTK